MALVVEEAGLPQTKVAYHNNRKTSLQVHWQSHKQDRLFRGALAVQETLIPLQAVKREVLELPVTAVMLPVGVMAVVVKLGLGVPGRAILVGGVAPVAAQWALPKWRWE